MDVAVVEFSAGLLPKIEHETEEAAKNLARRLLLLTVKDAYDLWEYNLTGKYKPRYRAQFGFTKNAVRAKVFRKHKTKIQEWVSCERFRNLCNKLNLNANEASCFVRRVLEGDQDELEKVQLLLSELQEETQNYARRGPREKTEADTQAQGSCTATGTRH